jgi:hypothetical protein
MFERLIASALLASALLALIIFPNAARAAEICHSHGAQYADTRTCVSSVLAAQGRSSYGPDQVTGLGEGAWCEGVSGPGIGQTITVHQKPEQVIGAMMIVNGYARTPQTFRANGRVKRAKIETSGGVVRTVTLKDTSEMEEIKVPPSRVAWIRLTILEVYPGDRHADTCISKFYFNHEEFGAIEEERK